ncbi:MAG: N-acetyl-gamma-glutamyl-phosphate reductase [Brevinema sp.]
MKTASIIGASGYTGAELLRILSNHPHITIHSLTSENHCGKPLSTVFPALKGFVDNELISMDDYMKKPSGADVCFLALPHGTAMSVVPKLLARGEKVIDLGADYRFSQVETYEKWYHQPHTDPQKAVYGLPELHREEIKKAKLLANPGCYPTASILALAPLLEAGLIDPKSIIIDAKSGVSGAGRSPKTENLFCEASEGFAAYGVASHRHTPEIEQELGHFHPVMLTFTPHLVPMIRGILATCYATIKGSAEDIEVAFHQRYDKEPFVRLLGLGGVPSTKYVRGSNYIDIAWHIDHRTGRIIVLSAIDNVVKGASGQAIQNMNLMFGWDETTALALPPQVF